MKNYAIILASGTGSRFGSDIPKQFIEIAGKTVLEHSVEIFENSDVIDEIILVITPDYRNLAENILLKRGYTKLKKLLNGGETRKDSSYIGISSIEESEANVLIHDCARPCLKPDIINSCIEALKQNNAINVAIPSTDTIVEVKDNIIINVPSRSSLMRVQTPQGFKLSVIKKAHELSKGDSGFTDDCGLVIKHNLSKVTIVEGDTENIKLTYPEDFFMAEKILLKKNF